MQESTDDSFGISDSSGINDAVRSANTHKHSGDSSTSINSIPDSINAHSLNESAKEPSFVEDDIHVSVDGSEDYANDSFVDEDSLAISNRSSEQRNLVAVILT